MIGDRIYRGTPPIPFRAHHPDLQLSGTVPGDALAAASSYGQQAFRLLSSWSAPIGVRVWTDLIPEDAIFRFTGLFESWHDRIVATVCFVTDPVDLPRIESRVSAGASVGEWTLSFEDVQDTSTLAFDYATLFPDEITLAVSTAIAPAPTAGPAEVRFDLRAVTGAARVAIHSFVVTAE
jgi:hypothetical protein